MTEFVTKDSGERQSFESGARRDISEGKPRYDLISLAAMRRWAELMGRGAEKYGSRNWELGMPVSRFLESGLRHFYQLLEGDTSEDHAAAVLFNIGAVIHFEDSAWDDRQDFTRDVPNQDGPFVEWIIDVDDEEDGYNYLDDDNLTTWGTEPVGSGSTAIAGQEGPYRTWILDVLNGEQPEFEQLTFDFDQGAEDTNDGCNDCDCEAPAESVVNWENLLRLAKNGTIDASEYNWPPEYREEFTKFSNSTTAQG